MRVIPEVPLNWRSTKACTGGAACVEVAALPDGGAAIRDGKNPQGPALRFAAAGWSAFVEAVKGGEFDPSA